MSDIRDFGVRAAVIPWGKPWPHGSDGNRTGVSGSDDDDDDVVWFLKVYFMGTQQKWLFNHKIIDPDMIMDMVNRHWNMDGILYGNRVPKFKLVDKCEDAHIRVRFQTEPTAGIGGSWAKLGSAASEVELDKPTMVLNLNNCADDYRKQATILHEFGHTLGLAHEHQHPEYWKVMEKFYDRDAMLNCSGLTTKDFMEQNDPLKAQKLVLSQYDPDSIMHYPTSIKMLKEEYQHLCTSKAVEKDFEDGKLTEEEAMVLQGFVMHLNCFVKSVPSILDKQTVAKAYHEEFDALEPSQKSDSPFEKVLHLCDVVKNSRDDFDVNLMLHSHNIEAINVSTKRVRFQEELWTNVNYSLLMVPLQRGKHKVQIDVDQYIHGRSFRMDVSIQPEQLKLPWFTHHEELQDVQGVRCSGSQVYVCTSKEIQVINCSSGVIEERIPMLGAAVAVKYLSALYVTTGNTHSVIKIDTAGNILNRIGKFGTRDGEFQYSSGIRISNGEIYVCDTGNNRIQVFDEDLKHVRNLGDSDVHFNAPRDLDFDLKGNIYVTDYDSDRIQVLTSSGSHIRIIGREPKEAKLKKPIAVAVHDNMVYVTDNGHERVAVFKTSGKFVTEFGNRYLTWPDSIAVDKSGFVCVSNKKCEFFIF